MYISSLRQEALLPDSETVIGKSITIQGVTALIASITCQDEKKQLWIFHHQPQPACDEMDFCEMRKTNRGQTVARILGQGATLPYIASITMQGQTLYTCGSAGQYFGENWVAYMMLQHFMEKGVDLSSIEDIPLNELALIGYELQEGTPLPIFDPTKDAEICLTLSDSFREVLIDPPLYITLSIGEHASPAPYTFYDHEEKKNREFYINRIFLYDPWEEMEKLSSNETVQKQWRDSGMTEAQITELTKMQEQTTAQLCPKGQKMAVVQYETPDEIQLCFHTPQFLASAPNNNGCASVGFIFSNDDAKSLHGFTCRSDMLTTVPKDFHDTLDIELISWYRKISGGFVKI